MGGTNAWSAAGLTRGAGGAIYGLAIAGGANGFGALYKLQPPSSSGAPWTESVAYSFDFPYDAGGGEPTSLLVSGKDGSFYVSSYYGGGALLQLQPQAPLETNWSSTLLWVSPKTYLGAENLISGPDGSFYGVGQYGGMNGNGNVFQLSPPVAPGGKWRYKVLHLFGCCAGHVDHPNFITLASDGTIYGTTYGTSPTGSIIGVGAVYSLTPPASQSGKWAYSVLQKFGQEHVTVPLVISNGNLYGAIATGKGGAIFKLQPPTATGGSWNTTYLHRFTNNQVPTGTLVVDKEGTVYGTTGSLNIGPPQSGTIFRITTK